MLLLGRILLHGQHLQLHQHDAAFQLTRCTQVMAELMAEKAIGAKLRAPSISHGSRNLYMRGPLEEATRDNLTMVAPLLTAQCAGCRAAATGCCCCRLG